MSFFSSASHVQINGGKFINIGNDFNLQSIQPPGSVGEVLTGLEFCVDEVSGRRLEGAERTGGRRGTRIFPYDTSHRRHIISLPHEQAQSGFSADALPAVFSDYSQGQISWPEFYQPLTAHGAENEGAGQRVLHASHTTTGDRRETMLSAHSSETLPSLSASIPLSDSHQAPSHYPSSFPVNTPFHALGHPAGWDGYGAISSITDLPELGPGPHQPARYAVQPNIGSRAMVNDNLAFPWDRPPDAPATNINGGIFVGGNVNNIQQQGEAGFHILYRAIASDAMHDSAERFPQPRCHPETRTRLLDVLWNWACGIEPPKYWTSHDPDDPDDWPDESSSQDDNGPSSPILWLYGPAGSGKSAIAQSFCQKLKEEDRLGGSFFFKRGHRSRGNAKKLFPTLAYQLALLLPKFKQFISQVIERDPAIVDRSFSDQLQQLIIEPCRKSCLGRPVPIIVDGLDECEGEDVQQEILGSIGSAIRREEENLPILFFIGSRPESHIHENFDDPALKRSHRPLNINQSFQDVRKYLLDEFSRIHREHGIIATVPSPWPTSEVVEELVQKSSGYFIYVSTAVKFIDDKRFRPMERLNIILGLKERISGSPFDNLDQLYHQILCGVPLDLRSQLLEYLALYANTGRVYNKLYADCIEQLLELETGDLRLILRGLHSLIDLRDDDYDADTDAPTVYHASFLDFLADPSRSGPFHVGSPQWRSRVAERLLKALSSTNNKQIWYTSWTIGRRGFKYITSAEPSPNLLPLVQSIHPDFFLDSEDCEAKESMRFLDWLKTFNPLPDNSIQEWEDYTFMLLCVEAWDPTRLGKEQQSNLNCHNIWPLLSPQLIKFFQGCRLGAAPKHHSNSLFRIHVLLALSWEELRAAIRPLRELLGNDWARIGGLVELYERLLGPQDCSSSFLELAKGGLRVMAHPFMGYLRINAARGYGLFLRCCPHSADLLQILSEIAEVGIRPDSDYRPGDIEDWHNVVQWLKGLYPPPTQLIAKFEPRLKKPRTWERYSFDLTEKQWMEWWEEHKGYLEQPTLSL